MRMIRLFLICSLCLASICARSEETPQMIWLSPMAEGPTPEILMTSAFHDLMAATMLEFEPKSSWKVVVGEYTRKQLVEALELIEGRCEQKEPEKLSQIVRRPEFRLGPLDEFELVTVTSEELGLPTEAIKQKEIPPDFFKDHVEGAGYERCPPEAAVMLILRFHHHTDPIYVGAEGIVGVVNVERREPVIFFDNRGNICIAVRRISQSWNAPRVFIVMKSRKK